MCLDKIQTIKHSIKIPTRFNRGVKVKIKILGTDYDIEYRDKADDPELDDASGYCDNTIKTIVIRNKCADDTISDFEEHQKRVIRHEIIHAFLFESGIGSEYRSLDYGHDEVMIDWYARMNAKIQKAFRKVGCL